MILHINGNYPYHRLHSELVNKLADMGYSQIVYIPKKNDKYNNAYRLNRDNVEFMYADILSKFDRVWFKRKIRKISRYIKDNTNIEKIDCVLAYTLFSDGAAAYELKMKYDIPYSVCVRDTDINMHMKFRPHLIPLMKKIISNATHVIFISPSYQNYLSRNITISESEVLNKKAINISNSINNYWFQHNCLSKRLIQPLKLIFVGELNKRKNVKTLIKIVKELKERNIQVVLDIVGDGKQKEDCITLSEQLGIKDCVIMNGWVEQIELLKKYYDDSHIFVMLSFTETFGTVYLEALSQGIPILYTKGQGVDGYFEEGSVGYSCDPVNIKEAADKIILIMDKYNETSQRCIDESKKFTWDVVSQKYSNVIQDMLNKE